MAKSIISNERVCLICGTNQDLHKHHIFNGYANRRLSEQFGCWCYLCGKHHNLSDQGVHNNEELNLYLKKLCQEKWEALNGGGEDARKKFIKRFGINYL